MERDESPEDADNAPTRYAASYRRDEPARAYSEERDDYYPAEPAYPPPAEQPPAESEPGAPWYRSPLVLIAAGVLAGLLLALAASGTLQRRHSEHGTAPTSTTTPVITAETSAAETATTASGPAEATSSTATSSAAASSSVAPSSSPTTTEPPHTPTTTTEPPSATTTTAAATSTTPVHPPSEITLPTLPTAIELPPGL